jgi:hypothetical protein
MTSFHCIWSYRPGLSEFWRGARPLNSSLGPIQEWWNCSGNVCISGSTVSALIEFSSVAFTIGMWIYWSA